MCDNKRGRPAWATVALSLTCTIVAAGVALARAEQLPRVTVGPITTISTTTGPQRFFEPHLAVDPEDSRHLLAGVVLSWSEDPLVEARARTRCAAFTSRDEGTTWTRHDFDVVNCADPQVALLPNGEAVFVALAELPNVQPKDNAWLLLFRSEDGGTTWQREPTVIGRPHDHPAITVDLSATARRGWLYLSSHYTWRDGDSRIASGVFLVRSRNGGRTFDAPTVASPTNMHHYGEMPVVAADGSVFVSLVDDLDDRPYLERRRAWVLRSDDGGTTLTKPYFINDECGPPPAFQLSAFAVDLSTGPTRDRLYFACRKAAGGPIIVSSSADRGRTWNRPGVAVGPIGADISAQRVVTMAVDGRGVVGVMVAERRVGSSTGCLAFSLATSLDGGATFAPATTLSSSACGSSPQDQVAERRLPTYGDYFGLVGLPQGGFQAVWPEMREQSTLLTARVSGGGPATIKQ